MLVLTACTTVPQREFSLYQLGRITKGMPEEQVAQLMPEPSLKTPQSDGSVRWEWRYKNKAGRRYKASITCARGKVVSCPSYFWGSEAEMDEFKEGQQMAFHEKLEAEAKERERKSAEAIRRIEMEQEEQEEQKIARQAKEKEEQEQYVKQHPNLPEEIKQRLLKGELNVYMVDFEVMRFNQKAQRAAEKAAEAKAFFEKHPDLPDEIKKRFSGNNWDWLQANTYVEKYEFVKAHPELPESLKKRVMEGNYSDKYKADEFVKKTAFIKAHPELTEETRQNLLSGKTSQIEVEFKLQDEETARKAVERRKKYVEEHPALKPEFVDVILKGTVCLGMSREDVQASWGPPNRVFEQASITGKLEQWQYSNMYLYFQDGVLTTWQNFR